MNERKIKKLNIRITVDQYNYLKERYIKYNEINENKIKTFSDYIRYILF